MTNPLYQQILYLRSITNSIITMQNVQFPINFKFKITSLANDFTATDAGGNVIAYVKQKMFKFKEDISIFSDETQTKVMYKIKADRWLDFSAAYSFYDENGNEFGKIVRKGWRSIWKTNYELIDQNDQPQYKITEENAWVKVLDSLFGQIPVLNIFTGYSFNPTYLLTNSNEDTIVKLKKQASFFGRNFEVEKIGSIDNDDDDRIMLGLMMMILLERHKG